MVHCLHNAILFISRQQGCTFLQSFVVGMSLVSHTAQKYCWPCEEPQSPSLHLSISAVQSPTRQVHASAVFSLYVSDWFSWHDLQAASSVDQNLLTLESRRACPWATGTNELTS